MCLSLETTLVKAGEEDVWWFLRYLFCGSAITVTCGRVFDGVRVNLCTPYIVMYHFFLPFGLFRSFVLGAGVNPGLCNDAQCLLQLNSYTGRICVLHLFLFYLENGVETVSSRGGIDYFDSSFIMNSYVVFYGSLLL